MFVAMKNRTICRENKKVYEWNMAEKGNAKLLQNFVGNLSLKTASYDEFVNCRGLAGFPLTMGSGERIWVGFLGVRAITIENFVGFK